jgi:hypothetical protein
MVATLKSQNFQIMSFAMQYLCVYVCVCVRARARARESEIDVQLSYRGD